MAKVCVIGSNAFSGQDFIDLLLDDPGHEVIGISRSPEKPDFMLRYKQRADLSRFRFHRFDLNRDMLALLDFLDAEAPDSIVNFAAQSEVGPSWDHPEHWFQTNAVALARLVNHLRHRDYPERFLHVSSPEAYGDFVGVIAEDARDNPSTPFAASKSASDMLIQSYERSFGFPALFVRSTNVFGARQQLFKITVRTVILVRLGRMIALHGGGRAIKSFIHIRDVSLGERAVLERGAVGERYHLSPDEGIAVRDLVRRIVERMGERFEDCTTVVDERPGQDRAYLIDSRKARQAFGWHPEISLDACIDEVIAWVGENWDAIGALPLDYVHKP